MPLQPGDEDGPSKRKRTKHACDVSLNILWYLSTLILLLARYVVKGRSAATVSKQKVNHARIGEWDTMLHSEIRSPHRSVSSMAFRVPSMGRRSASHCLEGKTLCTKFLPILNLVLQLLPSSRRSDEACNRSHCNAGSNTGY